MGLAVLATGLPAAWLIKERAPIRSTSFVDWYVIHLLDYCTQRLLAIKAPLPRLPLHRPLPRRRRRHLPPLRSPLLPPPLRPLPTPLFRHHRRPPRRLQRFLCHRPSLLRTFERLHRTPKHPVSLSLPQCSEHACPLACLQHARPAHRVRHHQRHGQWRFLLHHAHGRRKRLWLRKSIGGHGHGGYGLGRRIFISKITHLSHASHETCCFQEKPRLTYNPQGAPIAGYLLSAYGGEHSTLQAYHPAMFYAGSLALGAAGLVAVLRLKINSGLLKRL